MPRAWDVRRLIDAGGAFRGPPWRMSNASIRPRPASGECRPHHTDPAAMCGRAARRSLDAGVAPIVIERAAHGPELLAEFLGRPGDSVIGECRLILPDLGDGEVVRPVVLLQHLIALRAGL